MLGILCSRNNPEEEPEYHVRVARDFCGDHSCVLDARFVRREKALSHSTRIKAQGTESTHQDHILPQVQALVQALEPEPVILRPDQCRQKG
jgi:hypothetical protein